MQPDQLDTPHSYNEIKWDFNKTLDSNMRSEYELSTVPLSVARIKQLQGQVPNVSEMLQKKMDEIRHVAINYVNTEWERTGMNDINRWYSYDDAYECWHDWVHFVMDALIRNLKT